MSAEVSAGDRVHYYSYERGWSAGIVVQVKETTHKVVVIDERDNMVSLHTGDVLRHDANARHAARKRQRPMSAPPVRSSLPRLYAAFNEQECLLRERRSEMARLCRSVEAHHAVSMKSPGAVLCISPERHRLAADAVTTPVTSGMKAVVSALVNLWTSRAACAAAIAIAVAPAATAGAPAPTLCRIADTLPSSFIPISRLARAASLLDREDRIEGVRGYSEPTVVIGHIRSHTALQRAPQPSPRDDSKIPAEVSVDPTAAPPSPPLPPSPPAASEAEEEDLCDLLPQSAPPPPPQQPKGRDWVTVQIAGFAHTRPARVPGPAGATHAVTTGHSTPEPKDVSELVITNSSEYSTRVGRDRSAILEHSKESSTGPPHETRAPGYSIPRRRHRLSVAAVDPGLGDLSDLVHLVPAPKGAGVDCALKCFALTKKKTKPPLALLSILLTLTGRSPAIGKAQIPARTSGGQLRTARRALASLWRGMNENTPAAALSVFPSSTAVSTPMGNVGHGRGGKARENHGVGVRHKVPRPLPHSHRPTPLNLALRMKGEKRAPKSASAGQFVKLRFDHPVAAKQSQPPVGDPE